MRIARLPLLLLPVIAIAIAVFLTALASALVDQVHLRGAYQVWQENETFAAACVALLAAMYAARPVYLQVRAQSVQAALDLLHRTEADTEAVISTRRILFEVRRAAIALAGEINGFGDNPKESAEHLKKAIADFMAIAPRELRALAERPTINSTDQMKIATLSCVLAIAQQMTNDMLIEQDGSIAHHTVAQERAFLSSKLAGLFGLSSEIAEDLEGQEEFMRTRAQHLRERADTL
jgi:ribosomal protein L22